ARLARMTSPALVERLAECADPTRPRGARMTRRAAAVLRLGAADEFARTGDAAGAAVLATRALEDADTAELAPACLGHGAWPAASIAALPAVDLVTLPIGVGPDEHLHDA